MNEEEIYVQTKHFLLSHDWIPLGGDPPKGTDLTRIEIKMPEEKVQSIKKNENSIINDLVFGKERKLLLIENKPQFNKNDVSKLNKLVDKEKWRKSFSNAMKQRNLLDKYESIDRRGIISGESLVKTLAFEGYPQKGLEDFVQICWEEGENKPLVEVGNKVKDLPSPFSY
ncbi:MAG: hypothetical protein ABEJ56_03315 [Candidatus Nanohaloarchaea archaeon]